jgi:hypothetical protein
LHDTEHGVRRLYIRLKPEPKTETPESALADLLLRRVPWHEW